MPKYEAWARGTGPDFRLRILQGSWNPGGVKQSAGTHDGGGVVDVPGSADDTVNAMVRDAGRATILVVMHRDDDEGWDPDHHHAIDPACPGLSTAAADQVREWLAGGDGLIGDKADRGSRKYEDQVRAQFAARLTPKPAPVSEEDDMTLDELLKHKIASPTNGKLYTLESWWVGANVKAGDARAIAAKALAKTVALEAAVGKLAAAQGLDQLAIIAAVNAAVDEALDDVKITLTTTEAEEATP